jgi:hypothetical protein
MVAADSDTMKTEDGNDSDLNDDHKSEQRFCRTVSWLTDWRLFVLSYIAKVSRRWPTPFLN